MRGATLLELTVALTVMALVAGLAVLSVASVRPPPADPWRTAVAHARAAALRTGRPVAVVGDSGATALLLPDGRALGPGLDPLTGEVLSASR